MHDEIDDPQLDQARRHLSLVARGLVLKFGAELAAATLLGAATGALLERGTDADVAVHLRALADELERDDTAPIVGHG